MDRYDSKLNENAKRGISTTPRVFGQHEPTAAAWSQEVAQT